MKLSRSGKMEFYSLFLGWKKLQPMLERAVWELKQKAEEKGLQISLHNTDVEAYFDLKWTGEAIGNVILIMR